MSGRLPLLVFTDLDGTLLDHETYDWSPARPALDRLAGIGAGVILASSKTAAEIAPLRDELGLSDWPAIVENGCGLLEAGAPGDDDGDATEYQRLRTILHELPTGFTGFGDMDAADIARLTGLPADAARRAGQRRFSEPGTWTGTEVGLAAFLDAARANGIHARRGGRFLTLSFGGTKADRMDEVITRYRPGMTVALGDAPNDVEMLQRADRGIIVANPASDPLPELDDEADGRITRTTRPGPEGWAEAMLALQDKLNHHEDTGHDG
ncbi:HAD-IIB family hydrolase [Pelagovum pacificum]|uniref:HAD-IIB family hydrolase n=1 Tax=Pelagovum pacificum TaxID=2588711 RepID=A0A5C5GG65_9RHOB|nr:HAD-IIB family hydrolase [Pelagovum pacificum]QQA43890.1 HAD-IIB family hydrolase [Pelagovum pacificum]TNY32979.1 HAD-IIB family hydrolase [Pelagovum pacificum]